MRCDFSKEEIKNYAEGGLSKDKTEEIKNHIDICDECRRFYGVLTVSGNFASREIQGDKHFYKRVVENIDKDRYKERKMKYRIGSVLSRIGPVFKPVFAAAVFCVITLIIVINGQNIRDFVGSTFGDSNLAGNTIISESNEEQTLNPTSVADSDKAVKKRPAVKMDKIQIEGMDETHQFNLIESDKLGFSTYISDDLLAEVSSINEGDQLNVYTNYIKKINRDVSMIFFSPNDRDGITSETLLKTCEEQLKGEGYTVSNVSDKDLYFNASSDAELRANKKTVEKGNISIMISAFKHGTRFYRIIVQYSGEFGEGFIPRVDKILKDIVWYDEVPASNTHDDVAEIPKVFQNLKSNFNGTTVPFYYPAYLPDSGPFRLINFNASTEGYSFDVIRSDKYYPPTKVVDVPVSMADQIVSVSASQKPFSPYPTEEQLLEKPPADLDLDGERVKSYDNGMEVIWKKGTWEFYAIGHSEQDGIRVAKEILEAVKGITDLVPGAIRGKIRTAQLGNPMYVTASWTYDGNTWYTLDGRSSPEIMVKMLQSIRK